MIIAKNGHIFLFVRNYIPSRVGSQWSKSTLDVGTAWDSRRLNGEKFLIFLIWNVILWNLRKSTTKRVSYVKIIKKIALNFKIQDWIMWYFNVRLIQMIYTLYRICLYKFIPKAKFEGHEIMSQSSIRVCYP